MALLFAKLEDRGMFNNMDNVKLVDLTADRLEETLEVFRIGGWEENSMFYVRAEMKAFLNGDIEGYIRARFIVAIVDDCVIGAAAWAPSMCGFAVYELSWATVLPEWRHRGINVRMLQERIRQIRVHHGTEAFNVLVCTWENPMYAKAGFLPMQPNSRHSKKNNDKCLLLAQFGSAAQ
ncbi:GNAT family N-acetyltransferase [Sporomusa malonica]|uniref:Acetyltransferase (GNAT) family protein n=1 Tax=Sporomusa malonica TaxID=112901 RepID=A0A1W1ZUK5_9FIRM|nr:GNAT family N-acetyltransferase [Sporomusa malonica]SMC52084.1 Acetyltransferase (GNAT) family protein [Sporomusa malonica]